MPKPTFENGSLVRLKSGGPIMTVDHPVQQNSVVCCWFDDTRYASAIFNVDTISIVSDSENTSQNASID